jgi:hypothetical protein
MEKGDHVEVGLNTGKHVGPGAIFAVVDDVSPEVAAVMPTVSVVVRLPWGKLSIFSVPRGWLTETGPHRYKIDLPDRGQFTRPEEEETAAEEQGLATEH